MKVLNIISTHFGIFTPEISSSISKYFVWNTSKGSLFSHSSSSFCTYSSG
mgnify:CR=1 FL=1